MLGVLYPFLCRCGVFQRGVIFQKYENLIETHLFL